jgi:hypothetical protein
VSAQATTRQLANDARLLRFLEEQRQREHDAWQEGYRAGFVAGDEVGYDRAHEEMAAEWRQIHEGVQRTARTPTHDELDQLRRTPGGAVYQAALERRGGREYEGGKVDEW